MSAVYTRKGSFARSVIKTILGANSIFNGLSDSIQNGLIDSAVQRIASLRNSLSKEDYEFDTIASSDILTGTPNEYTKYLRFVVVKAGNTYNSTLYADDTIIDEQDYGFSNTPTVQFNIGADPPEVVDVISSGEFEVMPTIITSNWDITWNEDPDNIAINIADPTVTVVVIEMYTR